jgi:DNA modification methylase
MSEQLIVHDRLEMLPVAELIPFAQNARTHSAAQVQQIAASMREFGFTNPILIGDDNGIIAGHGRLLPAETLGLSEVPCIRLSNLSVEQRRAYVIADNKLALNAGWDDELLRLELGALRDEGFDLSLTGFGDSELAELFVGEVDAEGLTDDDALPERADWYVSRSGDVWICGDHRVMCGDSLSVSAVEALCGAEPIDCCWTDPPYNVNYEGSAGKIANDHMPDADFREFLREAFLSAFGVMRPGAPIYVAHADTEGENFRASFREAGFKLSGCLIWVKNSLVLGRSDYQWRHEPILYGWKPGGAHSWYGGRAKTTVTEMADAPFVVMADGSVQIEIGESTLRISGENLQAEELLPSTVRAEKPKRNAEHPTMKPVELVLGQLKNSSKRGDRVLDLFGGSGSTLIACQKSGRKARLMEFDAKFADVIVRRWQQFSGKKAKLEASGETFDALEAKKRADNAKAEEVLS